MQNAKGSHKGWRITEKKRKGTRGKKNKKKESGFWQGICNTNDAKIQNGAVCAGDDKNSESNRD